MADFYQTGIVTALHRLKPKFVFACAIALCAWIDAAVLRWLIHRIFKGLSLDKFLRPTGIVSVIGRPGRFGATHIAAEGAYRAVLLSGGLPALSAFHPRLTEPLVSWLIAFLPKAVTAGAIVVAGLWLS